MRPQKINGRPVVPAGRTPSRGRSAKDKQNGGDQQVCDLDPVEVYCRIRPLDVDDSEKCVKMLDDTTIKVVSTDMQYKFTKVFGETTSQKQLFDCVGSPLIDDLVRGKNGLLFTYGITSSGKTYTMTGTGDDQGILPRCLDMVFNSIENVQARKYVFTPDKQNGFDVRSEADAMLERQQREVLPTSHRFKTARDSPVPVDYSQRDRDPSKVLDIDEDSNYAVFVSFIEIYNNYIYDLLEELPYDPITGNKPPQSKILREDLQRVMFVHNVSEVEVKSTEEAFDILVKGQKRRKVAHTVLNAESSRSHSVFNIRLVQAPLDNTGKDILTDKNRTVVSQLSLVDLAGSERTNRTKNSGDRLKEAGQINQSLMVLRQCIDLLRENQKNGTNKMVPYRDSKITHLFKNYFDGEGKVRMIICVNPRAAEHDETLHVMRFAEAAQEVQVHRAKERPKFIEDGFVRGRRKLAAEDFLTPVIPAKKPSLEKLPHNPVAFEEIYSPPGFPTLIANPMDTADCDLHQLQDFLAQLEKYKQKQLISYQRKQDSFRQLLLTVDKDTERLRSENHKLCEGVRERDRLIDDISKEKDRQGKRLHVAEKELRALRNKITTYEEEKKELEQELHTKDWELHKTDYQIAQQRVAYERQVAQAEVDYENQLEAEKLRIEQQARDNLTVKERKLRLLRNIVNMSDVDSIPGELAADSHPPRNKAPSSANSTPHTASYATPTQSSIRKETERSRPNSRNTMRTPIHKPRARSPPATSSGHRPTPARFHRRSRSAGDRWLDHRPEAIQPLDTVLQPKIKKKKSVGKLEVKDTNKASKYLLTTQDKDSKGNVETKLVKGDVRASAGGGSSVVFTEVETLKQISPGDRRRQYIPESKDDYDGEWTDTEERCNIGVEGHGVYRRIQQFDAKAAH